MTRVNPEGHSIVYHVAIQGDGGILLAGSTAPFVSRDPRWLLARLLSNGAHDSNYPDQGPQPDLGRPSVAQRVGVQSTGHIVVAGKSAGVLRGYRFHPQSTESAIAMVTPALPVVDAHASGAEIRGRAHWTAKSGSLGRTLAPAARRT